MAGTSTKSSSPKGGRNWLKLLLNVGAVIVVLVLVVYFFATSSFFLKSVVLPRVSSALNASVTAGSASIHPFSEITLRNLKVQAAGKEPLVTVNEVHLRYHLWDIIGGNIHVDEIAVDSPTVELVTSPDGTSNLDPILKALQEKPAAEKPAAPSGGPAKPLKVDLVKLTVSNANIRQIINYPGGTRDVAEVTNLNLTLSNLKNGETAKLEISAGVHVAKNPPKGPDGNLGATLKGNFDVALSPDLKPGTVNGGVNLSVASAGGMFSNLEALGDSDGMVGLNFAAGFLREDGGPGADVSLDTMVRHIDYLVERLGIERVGLGSDFDGATIPAEIGDVAGLPRLLAALRATGFDDDAMRKVTHENWIRVLRKTWK